MLTAFVSSRPSVTQSLPPHLCTFFLPTLDVPFLLRTFTVILYSLPYGKNGKQVYSVRYRHKQRKGKNHKNNDVSPSHLESSGTSLQVSRTLRLALTSPSHLCSPVQPIHWLLCLCAPPVASQKHVELVSVSQAALAPVVDFSRPTVLSLQPHFSPDRRH